MTISHGILSEKNLEEARNAKAVYGGRLGTNLVQLGFLQMEELAVHLSRCLDVQQAQPRPPGAGDSAEAAAPLEKENSDAFELLLEDVVSESPPREPAPPPAVVAMFLVAKGIVRGFRGCGEGLSGPLGQIEIPVPTQSLFAQPVLTWQPFRGAPPSDGIDGGLLDTLGRGEAREVLVLPVPLRSRVVSLLYADNGSAVGRDLGGGADRHRSAPRPG